jgi:hypothetical protein
MPRNPRLPRIPTCPACDRPGAYVWQAEGQRDSYVCVTPSCPSDDYQRHTGSGLGRVADEL